MSFKLAIKAFPKKITISQFVNLFFLICSAGFIFKQFNIFCNTARDLATRNWPHNSLYFEPFHRFSDWLITLGWSRELNPWDSLNPLAQHLPAAPYPPLMFTFVGFLSQTGRYFSFFIVLACSLFLWLLICKGCYGGSFLRCFSFFAVFIALNYPVGFLVDRGNVEIIPILVFSILIIFLTLKNRRIESCPFKYAFIIFTVLLCSLKPGLAPILPFIFLVYGFRIFIFAILGVFSLYLYPVLYGVHITDFIDSLRSADKSVGDSVFFNHNLSILLRSFTDWSHKQIKQIIAIVGCGYYIFSFIYIVKMKRELINIHKSSPNAFYFLVLAHLVIFSLLFQVPSADYRLCWLIPIFLALFRFHLLIHLIPCLCFAFIFSHFNFISASGGFNTFIFRPLLILVLDFYFLFSIYALAKKYTVPRSTSLL